MLNVTLQKSVLQATAVTVTIVLPASEKGHVFNFTNPSTQILQNNHEVDAWPLWPRLLCPAHP